MSSEKEAKLKALQLTLDKLDKAYGKGTRSKNGKPKEFAKSGLKILCKNATWAYVVPITINNSWKMVKFGAFPMGLGNHLQFIIHEAIPVSEFPLEELMVKTEKAVIQSIKI